MTVIRRSHYEYKTQKKGNIVYYNTNIKFGWILIVFVLILATGNELHLQIMRHSNC